MESATANAARQGVEAHLEEQEAVEAGGGQVGRAGEQQVGREPPAGDADGVLGAEQRVGHGGERVLHPQKVTSEFSRHVARQYDSVSEPAGGDRSGSMLELG